MATSPPPPETAPTCTDADTHTAHTDDTDERVERASRLVTASPQEIFDLLADPRRHHEIDGSDTVHGVVRSPARLSAGSRFTMQMRLGVPYRMTSEVVEFDEPRTIAWRHLGHHVWRYRLEPAEGGTLVTEEFDWAPSRVPVLLKAVGAPRRNAAALTATLDRLAARFA